jgi:hypothetical protein
MKVNFCKADSLMAICRAEDPSKCRYYKQSTYYERCMYQSFELDEGYHCSCSNAQTEAIKTKKEDDESIYAEYTEGHLPT